MMQKKLFLGLRLLENTLLHCSHSQTLTGLCFELDSPILANTCDLSYQAFAYLDLLPLFNQYLKTQIEGMAIKSWKNDTAVKQFFLSSQRIYVFSEHNMAHIRSNVEQWDPPSPMLPWMWIKTHQFIWLAHGLYQQLRKSETHLGL